MSRKSSIDRLPEKIRRAIDTELAANRLTLDEVLERITQEYGENNAPSRSALHRRKQNMEKILAKHRQTEQVMAAMMGHLGQNDGSEMSRGIIEMMRLATFQVVEELSGEDEPDVAAMSAVALMLKRLASAEDVTLNVRKKARDEALAAAESNVEKKLSAGPRKLDADTLKMVREAIRGAA